MHRWTRPLIAATAAFGMVVAGTTSAPGAATDWRIVPHPATEATLKDIVALSGTDAWAVGERRPPLDTGYPLAEHWDGTSWSVVPVPASPTGAGILDGVDAAATDDVWAVGDSSGQGPFLRHWNGTEWTVAAPASPPGGEHPGSDRLYDVATVSRGLAWAVGRFANWNGPAPQTLVERWNGQTWSRVPAPNPGVLDNTLQDVDAVSATDAWAVGWSAGDTGNIALILRWNGTAWTRSPVTLPAGNTELQGVTAVSAKNVWAVGTNEGRPMVLHWNGTGWRVLPRPSVADAWPQTAAPDGQGGVWVAGYRITDGGTVERPLFLHWTGGRWVTGTTEETEGTVYGTARSGSSIWAVGTTSPCSCFVAPPLVEINGPSPAATTPAGGG